MCTLVYLSGCASSVAQTTYTDVNRLLEEVKERSILFKGLNDPSVVYFMDGRQDSLTITPIPDQYYSEYFDEEITKFKCYEYNKNYIVTSQFIGRTLFKDRRATNCRKTVKTSNNTNSTGIPPAPSGFEPQSFLFIKNDEGRFELLKSGLFNPRFSVQ